MINERIIEDFFRSLRVALTNAFSYAKDHSYFVKSVEKFKLKLEEILAVSNPLKIGVTSFGLVVDGKNLTQIGFYDELARLLHQRKIKSIEIRKGANLAELVGFLSVISMAQKDIFKNGGVSVLLEKKQLVNFTIEELDYSAFLHGDGQECVDIWGFMLKEAVQSNDEAKINKLADNFGTLVKRINQNDVFDNQEILVSINEFLVCLRNKDKEKFDKCTKDLFLGLLPNKKLISKERLVKLKQIFDSLNQEDFSALFWEGLLHEDNFDALSLSFFSQISEAKDSSQIAQGILNKDNAAQYLNNNPKVVKRIQDLLTLPQDDCLSAVYRHTLELLIKGIVSSGVLFFDQKALEENYRYVVLNIFSFDEDKDNLQLATEVLEKELKGIVEHNDICFLKDLWSQLLKRKKEGLIAGVEFERKFSAFIENIILDQPLLPEQDCFLKMVSSPSQEAGFYLNKIFSAEKANKQVLNLFFKFFPGELDIFYQRVKQKLPDIDFIFSLIDVLGQLDLSVIPEILEHIYFSTSELIKVEVLNTLRKLKRVDARFLLSQLNTNSFSLRKKLLSVLILDAQAKNEALILLFKIPNFCGTKNWLLIENMQIVFNLGITQAVSWIQNLSQRKFFWNQELRNKAKEILKEWNAC